MGGRGVAPDADGDLGPEKALAKPGAGRPRAHQDRRPPRRPARARGGGAAGFTSGLRGAGGQPPPHDVRADGGGLTRGPAGRAARLGPGGWGGPPARGPHCPWRPDATLPMSSHQPAKGRRCCSSGPYPPEVNQRVYPRGSKFGAQGRGGLPTAAVQVQRVATHRDFLTFPDFSRRGDMVQLGLRGSGNPSSSHALNLDGEGLSP